MKKVLSQKKVYDRAFRGPNSPYVKFFIDFDTDSVKSLTKVRSPPRGGPPARARLTTLPRPRRRPSRRRLRRTLTPRRSSSSRTTSR